MIFNAHPRLYWGQYGANSDPAWLEIGARRRRAATCRIGDARASTPPACSARGRSTAGGAAPRLPGLGDDPVELQPRAGAALAPDLRLALRARASSPTASGASVNGHLRRDLLPRRGELAPRHLWQDIKRPRARCASRRARRRGATTCCRSSPISAVIFVLLPLMILTGLTMSPAMDAAWPWLLDLFGGRQSARSIHFIAAGAARRSSSSSTW